MTEYNAGSFDIAVVGAGHAGIEAALAASRLGLSTALFTINLDAVGNMPCNPSIGGTGKSHIVYEIDALGGEMGFAADKVTLQSRTLNLGKGPAVHSKRIQADRRAYQTVMKKTLENEKNLSLIQSEVIGIRTENGAVSKLVCGFGAVYSVKAVIIASGTYLQSRVIVGEAAFTAGPDGMLAAAGGLSASLSELGVKLMRFKTGTPPRIHADSIDYSLLERQEGDSPVRPFSVRTPEDAFDGMVQTPCYIVYTNAETHKIIRDNLHRSPLYTGVIEGTGPRYCPSIEDKIVRFADKERHQLFAEPVGADTKEIYLQGFSSSLPEEVQKKMLHSLRGFENAVMMRTAYAIEYDCADPLQLYHTLEFKEIPGLYGAGQFNGTSGYEEAAAQGLIAGINAALKIKGEEPLILSRDSSYIGTLIDDLVTKGTNEPYRIMTSRSEYRLLLRQDNTEERLTHLGHRAGLISDSRFEQAKARMMAVEDEIKRAEKTTVHPSPSLTEALVSNGFEDIKTGVRLAELLRRPGLDYKVLSAVDITRPDLPETVFEKAQVKIKYDGYIKKQIAAANKLKKLEEKLLPEDIDYNAIKGIRLEAAQKLTKIRPRSIGHASRISGISPADISVLLIYLSRNGNSNG